MIAFMLIVLKSCEGSVKYIKMKYGTQEAYELRLMEKKCLEVQLSTGWEEK